MEVEGRGGLGAVRDGLLDIHDSLKNVLGSGNDFLLSLLLVSAPVLDGLGDRGGCVSESGDGVADIGSTSRSGSGAVLDGSGDVSGGVTEFSDNL